ncbi:aldoxime dehydratase [Pseudomonas flavescens]|uniref:Aldoxime dehydratase n=1 Tax=Phytopseudomonas flavescens TaxID=29435 RepID=A0A1G8IRU5_9GAMM|nr:phenylacetaldoxime dehydratase family protein [Pseudomonas flavescens]SDI21581.1 aldoxime dehydratase [Pseudomonas flavescens]
MESAIAPHLRVARRQPSALPAGYQPPFPAWSARFDPLVGQVVMAYFGVQSARPLTLDDLAPITARFAASDGPLYWDPAACQDAAGAHNLMAIAYWADVEAFERWRRHSGFAQWWADPARESGALGWFLEVVSPTAERFETVHSAPDAAEGVTHLARGMSDSILEHGYWGSARDRLALAQSDPLRGQPQAGERRVEGRRVRLGGRDNLCLIRSGQDWSATAGTERELYLGEIGPVLQAGMHFLRDQGADVGCLNCRFMRGLDTLTGEPLEKTFGLAHFDDLTHLEAWARTHPTHVAIFGGFMRYVQALDFKVALRLYHEVAVIPAQAQCFEYLNCHPDTGLLRH